MRVKVTVACLTVACAVHTTAFSSTALPSRRMSNCCDVRHSWALNAATVTAAPSHSNPALKRKRPSKRHFELSSIPLLKKEQEMQVRPSYITEHQYAAASYRPLPAYMTAHMHSVHQHSLTTLRDVCFLHLKWCVCATAVKASAAALSMGASETELV
jgi:hypothetical protein